MNAVLGQNVRTFRELKHWTQQHLADTSGIQLRTVQRVEKGDGASMETLGALSNAFDLSVDLLQTDFSAVAGEVQRQEQELRKTHDLVPVTPVMCSAHLEIIGGSRASLMQCASEDDAVLDAFSQFKSNVIDMIDIWDDADPSHHREWLKSAYDQVEALNRLGIVVCVGSSRRAIRAGAALLECRILYLVAWPRGEEREVIAVEKVGDEIS